MTTTTSPRSKISTSSALTHPHRTIFKSFALWKLFLLAIAVGSTLVNDRAYDTSADLLLIGNDEPLSVNDGNGVAELLRNFGKRLVTRFTSWDAIYFVSAAKRGYVYEQEWAFGTGLVVCMKGVLRGEFPFLCLCFSGVGDFSVRMGMDGLWRREEVRG